MASDAYETIRWERSGPLGTLILNRPERRNGITPVMLDELYELLSSAATDPSLRVLVLRGAGGDFCPGADVKHYASERRASDLKTFDVSVFLHEMPAVTVAAIKGACAGAGLGWAAACDLRVSSTSARFNSAFLGVGLSGDMGGPWTLPRIIGAAKAREIYFLAEKFDAAEAARIGLVSRVFDDDAFDAELDRFVAKLTAAAPLALTAMKENFIAAETMTFPDFVAHEARRHTELGASHDVREAFQAFVDKRKPRFEGR